jgi:hypothetical protein
MGMKPGIPLEMSWNDARYVGWQKYSLTTIGGRDFHYNINEAECWYTDLKEKRTEEGR